MFGGKRMEETLNHESRALPNGQLVLVAVLLFANLVVPAVERAASHPSRKLQGDAVARHATKLGASVDRLTRADAGRRLHGRGPTLDRRCGGRGEEGTGRARLDGRELRWGGAP